MSEICREFRRTFFVDSHCHLMFDSFADFLKTRSGGDKPAEFFDVSSIVRRAAVANVKFMLNIGTQISEFERIIKISEEFPGVFASIGIHPENASEEKFSFNEMRDIFHRYGALQKTIAIGEIGLDYHQNHDEKVQKDFFHFQLEMAEELNLPVSIHSRDAWRDTTEILATHPKVTGVIHCFSGEKDFAEQILRTSFYFGIGGALTFKKNTLFQETVTELPTERILLETDAPFLAPVPFRGEVNEPALITKVAEKIAELKKVSTEEIAKTTSANFFNLFSKANLTVKIPK